MAKASVPTPAQALEPPELPRLGPPKGAALALMIGALGVVFGDIGTSPLYTVQTIFTGNGHAIRPVASDIYGSISLVFWTLTITVSVKYVGLVMRADNHGEGGVLALASLLRNPRLRGVRVVPFLIMLGVLGASLFSGDGAITPAISVLSAVEGLKVAAPALAKAVVPLAAVVLAALFALQRFGTHSVGRLFGPVMLGWFLTLALFGIGELVPHPQILRALSPSYGISFFVHHGIHAYFALGAVVLAVTGAEALYADIGHFGRSPISRAWFFIVYPALILNYMAQGSLLLRDPKGISNPFYLVLPAWAQLPMVFLATAATVIASQAVISGMFSVAQQAVQQGLLPRLSIRHTSEEQIGQIYVPAINAVLFVEVLAIVVGFGSSEALASAYGIAVTGTFVTTTIIFFAVARLLWRTNRLLVYLGAGLLVPFDLAFFTANFDKITHGGWLPLASGAVVFTMLTTWDRGRRIVTAKREALEGRLHDFIEQVSGRHLPLTFVPGIAVFLNPNLDSTPLALSANVRHNHVLHDHLLIVAVRIERVPHVPREHRLHIEPSLLYSGATGDPLGQTAERITRLALRFGYRDRTDVPAALAENARLLGCSEEQLREATYFLSKITITPTRAPGLAPWRKKLFLFLARNAADPATYFHLPDSQTLITSERIRL